MAEPTASDIARVRAFNRFYTGRLGVLDEALLRSDLALTEVRVLFEIADRRGVTAADLCRVLGLNAGYVSRLLGGQEARGRVSRQPSTADARASVLGLTDAGRAVVQDLDRAASQSVGEMIGALTDSGRQQLVESMRQIQALLDGAGSGFVLRDPRPGDMGWIVHRHGALYAREYGWNAEFEALVADIVARYVREHDPQTERCWIAEHDGAAVGSIFVVRHDAQTAKLRLLYVDASTRGLGIGQRLVDEAIAFARAVGYKRMVLWTNAVLTDACNLYARSGFELLTEQQEHLFGKPQVSQLWAKVL